MVYNGKLILGGQLLYFLGFLCTATQIIVIPLLIPQFMDNIAISMLLYSLPVLLAVLTAILVLCGVIITIVGAFHGKDENPYNLFIFGWFIAAGGLGGFIIAGIIHWSPHINPFWMGTGPKPEAATFSLYAAILIVLSLVVIARSIPEIAREMKELSRPQ